MGLLVEAAIRSTHPMRTERSATDDENGATVRLSSFLLGAHEPVSQTNARGLPGTMNCCSVHVIISSLIGWPCRVVDTRAKLRWFLARNAGAGKKARPLGGGNRRDHLGEPREGGPGEQQPGSTPRDRGGWPGVSDGG